MGTPSIDSYKPGTPAAKPQAEATAPKVGDRFGTYNERLEALKEKAYRWESRTDKRLDGPSVWTNYFDKDNHRIGVSHTFHQIRIGKDGNYETVMRGSVADSGYHYVSDDLTNGGKITKIFNNSIGAKGPKEQKVVYEDRNGDGFIGADEKKVLERGAQAKPQPVDNRANPEAANAPAANPEKSA